MQPEQVSDTQFRAMLDAFAGPATPRPPATPRRRRITRRTMVLLAAALVALGLAVPGALALLGYWETPKQFLSDTSQPAYAKHTLRGLIRAFRQHGYRLTFGGWGGGPHPFRHFRVLGVTSGLVVHPPGAEAHLYGLRLPHGYIGYLFFGSSSFDDFPPGLPPRSLPARVQIIPTRKPLYGPLPPDSNSVARPCRRGWALQRLGGADHPTPHGLGYEFGLASNKVASVHVRYHDGSTTKGAVGTGHFLVWMKPSAGWTNVTVIAEDAAGKTIGQLVTAGYGGIPYSSTPAKPGSFYACAP